MAIETELKLTLAPADMRRLARHALLRSLSSGRPVTRRVYNQYLDTPDFQLQQRAMALRLRRIGDHWLQTLKGGGAMRAGVHMREEWETPVAGEALDFSALKQAGARLPRRLREAVQPAFVTDFTRTTRRLVFEGAEIEVCLDAGEVRVGDAAHVICEVELELLSGEVTALFKLAQRILDVVPARLETVSKAEQGYRLLGAATARPARAELARWGAETDAATYWRSAVWACMEAALRNLPGALQGDESEFVHQLRVALRRLRGVLRSVARQHASPALAELRRQTGVVCAGFGRVREWDVMLNEVLPPLLRQCPDEPGLADLQVAAQRRRDELHDGLAREAGPALQRVLLGLALWLQDEAYWRDPAFGAPLPALLANRLARLDRRVRHGAALGPDTPLEQLHALRLRAKQLRYLTEAYAAGCPVTTAGRYVAALARVQARLGALNDLAAGDRLLQDLRERRHAGAIAFVRGWLAAGAQRERSKLPASLARFKRCKPCWS